MGGRGKERTVRCEKCGRTVRRDKAVFFEKTMFTNPVERKDVYDEYYQHSLRREVAYCPSCGKHMRIYEKKTKQLEQKREREQNRPFFSRPRPRFGERPEPQYRTTPKPVEKPVEPAA